MSFDATTAPQSCPSTVIGAPTDDRIPSSRTSFASSLDAPSQLSIRTGAFVRTICPSTVSGAMGEVVPTGMCLPPRLQPAICTLRPSGV